jgi:perosamine synthetase
MHAIGVGEGDEVILPPISFVATANSIVYQGGTPIFADVDADTLLIDPVDVEQKITKRTKAVIAVDYAGHPCDYEALRNLTARYGIHLIGDACHSLGARYKGYKVGSIADLTIFSFHPVKNITTGEGGMVVTDDEKIAEKIRVFRNHGIHTDFHQRNQQDSWQYEMVELGYNYRITDIQCALGLSQLENLPDFLEKRQRIAAQYNESLNEIEGFRQLQVKEDVFHAYHLYVVVLESGADPDRREAVFKEMRGNQIGVNVHYMPIHLHPFYRKRFGTTDGMCPIAESVYKKILSLPIHFRMSDNDVMDVVDAIKCAL